MSDILIFPVKKRVPQVSLSASPVELLEKFLLEAKKHHIVFLGVHAVCADGVLMQAATGLVPPEEEGPEDSA